MISNLLYSTQKALMMNLLFAFLVHSNTLLIIHMNDSLWKIFNNSFSSCLVVVSFNTMLNVKPKYLQRMLEPCFNYKLFN